MARLRAEPQSQNLDSLLDTLANVVGILVMLMAVTQISVGAAMERIRTLEATGMTPAALRALLARADALTDELATLRHRGRALPAPEQLPALDRGQAEALRARWRDEVEQRERAMARTHGELAALRVVLREAPRAEAAARRSVRLPDPRPAPPGARPLVFFCRYGRVLSADYDALTRQLESGMQAAVGRPSGYLRLSESDHPWIAHYFRERVVGSDALRWVVTERGPRNLVARLAWRRSDAGETPEALRRPDSALRRALASHEPSRRYVHFAVWADSFEAYLEARALAEARGYAAWWDAFAPDEEFEGNVYEARAGTRALVD